MQTGPLPAARVLSLTLNKKANGAPVNTPSTPLTEAEFPEPIKPTQPAQSALISRSTGDQSPPSQLPKDNSGSASDTLAPPDSLNIAPSTSSEMVVDDVPSAVTTPSSHPCDSVIQVQSFPSLGVSSLVQTLPPVLLFADEDERPHWLLTSIKQHIQHTPYYLCFNRVVDLFLAQEARLGYPAKVSILTFPHFFTH